MKMGSRRISSRSTNGQALVEYVLIIALISVVIIAVVKILGGYVMDAMTKTSCSISGTTYVSGKKPGEGFCSDSEEDWEEDLGKTLDENLD